MLIGKGCKLISQHADSMGAPNACETAKVPNVSYNGSTFEACPETFIVSSRINWAPYYKYLAEQIVNAKGDVNKANVAKDWTGTIATGSVELTAFGTAATADTAAKVADIKAKLMNGTLNVFDTATFTVNGTKLATYMANVNFEDDGTGKDNNKADTQVIENGVFFESKHRSAPYFDVRIDGITLLNEKY